MASKHCAHYPTSSVVKVIRLNSRKLFKVFGGGALSGLANEIPPGKITAIPKSKRLLAHYVIDNGMLNFLNSSHFFSINFGIV